MSDLMRFIDFEGLIDWTLTEYKRYNRIFGVSKDKFYKNKTGDSVKIFGQELSTILGPAAGPNSQLAQNIIASYLAGCRAIELKTVQKMDGEELRACVAKPCINAEDECYNVEWSTELTVGEAYEEYVKAYFVCLVLAKELGISEKQDFLFNMSVGYDLEGIKLPKIDNFIENLKDASNVPFFKECKEYLLNNIDKFENVDKAFVENISPCVSNSITLSTLHGCPKDEIQKIADYLLKEKKIHTFIKCNPTILGYDLARSTLDKLGFDYIVFDDHHFNNDLQFSDAVKMFHELLEVAKNLNLEFGVKITNTFPVKIDNNELPGEEMYMSGRSLFPLTINAVRILSEEFDGKLRISYSGGADHFNIHKLASLGVAPITFATTILKPGGYERVYQLALDVEDLLKNGVGLIDVKGVQEVCNTLEQNKYHNKSLRAVGSRKTTSELPLFDCYKAPCKDGGCPIEQQIPEYLSLVKDGKFEDAFKIIATDNATPSITGTICDHQCQNKCTRLDYDTPLQIRNSKLVASQNAQAKYSQSITSSDFKTNKKVAVIGAGPAGIASGLFLRRNGIAVTVFEKKSNPFGIVSHVIPEFRISKEAVNLDYEMAVKTGVEFKFDTAVGSIEELKKEFDFVIVATGAWDNCYNPIKGDGKVLDAIEFLEESKKSNLSVELGEKVAIIGGGDVAMDCARSAKRTKGVKTSTIVYRRTKAFMPSSPEEIRLASEDGVEFKELYSPVTFENGKLACDIMELGERDASGRKSVVKTNKVEGLAFDTVIIATGARVNKTIFKDNDILLDSKENPVLNKHNETNKNGVYIA
ncbi:MAG: putative selenate reductase subunit YgfK, partial [Lachnospirales bacterium]